MRISVLGQFKCARW